MPLANLAFRLGGTSFGAALSRIGLASLHSPWETAKDFGLPATTSETLAYIPVFGIRDLGFGVAILALLAASATGYITDGDRAAAIVTAAGACVGLGDSMIVRAKGGKGAVGHAIGGSVMAVVAAGLWMSA